MLHWSFPLFRIFGIRLAVHWSFLLFLGYIGWSGWHQTHTWQGAIWWLVSVLLVFVCVILHELGHCFVGQYYGVSVPRILLLPIGGMAEFSEIPREPPRQEIIMALAGPAVNFLLLIPLYYLSPIEHIRVTLGGVIYEQDGINALFKLLIYMNLMMGCFNLLPAFPMDGGRVLRAWLAGSRPYVEATQIAATVGKIVALLGALVMAFWVKNPLAAGLFVFIIIAGELEYRAVRRQAAFEQEP